jgi:hypothetical protein
MLFLGLFLSEYLFAATCPKDKRSASGITAIAVDAEINTSDTIALRWQQKFLDEIFKSARYCYAPDRADAYVIVSVFASDTNPSDFRNDRAAVSSVALFAADTRFLMHLLQVCKAVEVDGCAERALTQLDNQFTSYPAELKPKEKATGSP